MLLARWSDGVAREESSEIDQLKHVTQVRHVALKAYRAFFVPVKIKTDRNTLREVRKDAAAIKIQVVDDHLTVFRGILLLGQIRLKRQSGVVIGARRDPQARNDLITDACTHGIALVLGIWKMPAGRIDRIISQKQSAGHREPGISDDVGVADKP
jgi:hypothetical protein